MSVSWFLLLIVLGAVVGVIGTLIGAGGGFILTPILALLYPQDSPAGLTAISLAVVFFNAAAGSIAYARQRRIDYRSGAVFALATLPGAVAGALLVHLAVRRLFDALLAALLLCVAAWLVLRGEHGGQEASPDGSPRRLVDTYGTVHSYSVRTGRGIVYSGAVGLVSSFLGIGGGVLHVPLMAHALGFPMHIATATSHFVLANMSAAATATHVLNGTFPGGDGLQRTLALSLGVVAGAQLGAALSRHVTGRLIQRLLTLALVLIAVRLIIAVV